MLPIPPAILGVHDELLEWMFRQRDKKERGLTVTSDAMGNRTFSGPAMVTKGMLATLAAAGAMRRTLHPGGAAVVPVPRPVTLRGAWPGRIGTVA